MSVMIRRIGPDASKDRAQGILSSVFTQYEWQDDQTTYGRVEWWMGYLQQLKAESIIRDDCDGFSRLIIDLLFFLGGFRIHSLAECVVDVDQTDDNIFDHHVGAVKIGKKWFYFHCWTDQLLTRREIEDGFYKLKDGRQASPLKIIHHRKASSGIDGWKPGKVK